MVPLLMQQKTFRAHNIRAFSTLTHVDAEGRAKMVNIIDKTPSNRKAIARGTVKVGKEISALINQNSIKKGDVLSIAQIAGIMGAKQTSNLIPLTHNIALSSVKVELELKDESVDITATVECYGKTGVEIEALVAVSVAALTIYDMCKAVSQTMTIDNIHLQEKTGGKTNFEKK